MGVSGLLPLLKSIQKPTELKKYGGETFGVDAYGWLHRAAYSCALELGQGKPTKKYVAAALHRVRMLRHFGVTPYMVFDGDYLPSKAATEDSRAKSRAAKKKVAMDLLLAGKPAQATQEFQKCIDVTPEMAAILIQQLKKMDIPCVVAPYEADAQLVYLERHGFVSGIISDDSDLLVFGAKKLLTKLDAYGNCMEINRKDFCAVREVSLTDWTDTEFRRMAIMSGCDYLDGLPGVGLKTAYRKLRKTKSPERIVKLIQFEGKRVDENYLTKFYQAELTFLHQWVFCPAKKELVHLTELDGSRTAEEMPYIGAFVEPFVACGVAAGELHPMTKAPFNLPPTPSKRRYSQTTTPAPAPTSTQSPKPISSYFKGKSHTRIPMGNMDTNCFSVDPQRISQITHGGLLPRVFPLPRPYIPDQGLASVERPPRQTYSAPRRTSPKVQRRRTEPIGDLLSKMGDKSTPEQQRRGYSNTNEARVPLSEGTLRPQKKARLCEEAEGQDTSPKASKFFPAHKVAKSPRRSKSEAYLFSDDSIEFALSNLPDVDGFKSPVKSKKSITIFDESSVSTPATSEGDSQTTSRATQDSAQATSQSTAASTVDMEEIDVVTRSFSPTLPSPSPSFIRPPKPNPTRAVSTPFRANLHRFSFASSSSSSSTANSIRADSIFSMPSTASTATPATAASTSSSRLTPLQRLGAKALRPSSPSSLSPPFLRKVRAPPSSSRGAALLPGKPVNPSFIPLPKVDLDEVEALSRPCGSEDQIIPDSEGEEDGDEEEDTEREEGQAVTKLNLSRFAFG